MTSWGLTRATVRNHGRSPPWSGPAFSDSQWAALEAMTGSKWTPVPAQPMKCRSLPSQSAKPYASMSGAAAWERCHLPM